VGRRRRPGALPSIVGTKIDVLTVADRRSTVEGGKGGPVITLSAIWNTGYPQATRVFRSEKRAILAVERLTDSLAALTVKVDALESASRKLELEWVETYDKIRHQMSRMARRGDLSKGKGDDPIIDPAANDEPVMDPISAGIHARRSRSFLGRQ